MHALLVEESPDVASLIRRALLLLGLRVEVAANGAAALTALRDAPPDLLILDPTLPDLDGREICRRVRAVDEVEDRPPTPILIVSANASLADRISGYEAGADDYLAKPFDVKEFSLRVRALLRRARPPRPTPKIESEVLRFEDLRVDLATRSVVRGARAVRLTPREFDLLTLFLRHPNQVLSRAVLLDRLWGRERGDDSNVVPVAVGTLRRALEANGEPRVIQTVRGFGYALRSPE
jgi:two-component system response regulator MprA